MSLARQRNTDAKLFFLPAGSVQAGGSLNDIGIRQISQEITRSPAMSGRGITGVVKLA